MTGLILAIFNLTCTDSLAIQPLNGISATYDNRNGYTNDDYVTVGGGNGSAYLNTTSYNMKFNVTSTNNLIITAFQVGTNNLEYIQLSDRINLERRGGTSSNLHLILYELVPGYGGTAADTNVNIRPSYVRTMEESLRSANINRGADNVFCNVGDGNGNNNNIERIDYIFEDGYPLHDNLQLRGFLVMDRSGTTNGNDAFQLAAITALDSNKLPSAYSTNTVAVPVGGWGNSGNSVITMVARGYTENGDVQHPSAYVNAQYLVGVYITWQELGLHTNDIIYGYSLRGNDNTNALGQSLAWTNLVAYPTNTTSAADGGGLDLMSGGAMYFVDTLNAKVGNFVWDDWNGNGIQDAGEPGLSNVLVKVYDSKTNLTGLVRTGTNGAYQITGLAPDTYFVEFLVTNSYPLYTLSPKDVGTDDTIDSDADPTTKRSSTFSLTSGQVDSSRDAGAYLPPSDLRVTKSVVTNHPNIGDSIVFSIAVTNKGLYNVDFVQLTDILPTGVVYNSYLASTGTYTSTNGIWDVGAMPTGSVQTLSITATVETNTAGWTITNNVAITRMNRPDTNLTDNTTNAVLSVQIVDLGVTKTAQNSSPYEGSNFVYSITITNNGPDAATHIRLLEPLTNGLTYVGWSASTGVYINASGLWTNFSLASGQSATLLITNKPNAGTGGSTITNTSGIVWRDQVDSNPANDQSSAVIVVRGADLSVDKTVDNASPNELDNIVYTIVVRNLGPSDTTGVTLREPLTNGITYVTNTASLGTYSNSTKVWTIGSLAVGSNATLTITAQVNSGTIGQTITNWSSIIGNDLPDPVSTNNQDDVAIYVSPLQFSKTANVSVTGAGSNITYTIVFTNTSPVTQTGVTVTDPVPIGATYVSNTVTETLTPAVFQTNNVRDTFSVQAYTNNNGTTNWLSEWGETGDDGSATSGRAQVTNNQAQVSSNASLTRAVNLQGTTNASFSFSYSAPLVTVTNSSVDLFNSVSYYNNDGTANWLGPWVEAGGDTGQNSTSGVTRVTNNWALVSSNSMLTRGVDLSGSTNSMLSFSYRQSGILESNDVYDTFSTVAYNNQEGTINWNTDWTETGDDTLPNSGTIQVNGGQLRIRNANNGTSVDRNVLASGYTNGTLSFSWETVNLDSGETGEVYAVSNGTTYIVARFGGTASGSTNVNITPYLAATTGVRFVAFKAGGGAWSGSGGNAESFRVDNVRIVLKKALFDTNDIARVNVSSNGTDWVSLLALTGTVSDVSQSMNFDITPYISTNTQVRFTVTNYLTTLEALLFDNVAITSRVPNLTTADVARVQVSSDGTAWSTLLSVTGGLSGTYTTNFDITSYRSTNTQVRFGVTNYLNVNAFFFFDNVNVAFSNQTGFGTLGPPPTLLTGATMASGSVLTLTYTVLTDNPLYLSEITNTATLTTIQQPTPKRASVVTPTLAADLGVTKTVDNANPDESGTIHYSIVVTNNGPQSASGVRLTEPLATGITYVTNTVSHGVYSNAVGIWYLGNLTVSNSATLNITATVNTNTAGLSITNVSTIIALDQRDSNASNNQASAVIVVKGSDLGVVKTVDNPMPFGNNQVTYTIVLTNNGPTAATGVHVTDLLPTNVTYVTNLPSQGSYTPASGDWNVGSLGVGSNATLGLVALVRTNTVGLFITNYVAITTLDQKDRNPSNNTSYAVINPQPVPLRITKTSSAEGMMDMDTPYTYTVVVTNISAATQTMVTVTDPLPTGTVYVASSSQVSSPSNTINSVMDVFDQRLYSNNDGTTNWNGDWAESEGDGTSAGNLQLLQDSGAGLAPYSFRYSGPNAYLQRLANIKGATNAVLTFNYRIQNLDAGDSFTVSISSNGFGGAWSNLLNLTGPVVGGSYVSFSTNITQFISTNTAIRFGTTNLVMTTADIVWIDNVEIDFYKRDMVASSGGAPSNLATNFTLWPGEYMAITYQMMVTNPPSVTQVVNTAWVTSTQMPDPIYASVTDRVTRIDLGVMKYVSDGKPGTNELIQYQLVLTNNGPYTATSIQLTEYWPTNVVFSNAVPSQGSYSTVNPTAHVWSVGTVLSGSSATLWLTGRVSVVTYGVQITNTVVITHLNQVDTNSANNTSDVAVVTVVVVTRFEAYENGGQVVVEWETASEVGTAGYYVYRSGKGTNRQVQVNGDLVPALMGEAQGGSYRIPDVTARRGLEYSYQLEEVELLGTRQRYGPFDIKIETRGGTNQVTGAFERGVRISREKLDRVKKKKAEDLKEKQRILRAKEEARRQL